MQIPGLYPSEILIQYVWVEPENVHFFFLKFYLFIHEAQRETET